MSEFVNVWWLAAYAALALITLGGTLSAFIRYRSKIPATLTKLLVAFSAIGIAIVIHTAAILQFGSDNVQTIDFSIGHVILFFSFLALAIYSRKFVIGRVR